jgi:hypothetical protein
MNSLRLRSSIASYLGEANSGRVLTEALTADVESVLADQTGGVSADTAIEKDKRKKKYMFSECNPKASFHDHADSKIHADVLW